MGTGHTILNTSTAGAYDAPAAATAITAWLNGVMDASLAVVSARLQSAPDLVDEDTGTITGAVSVAAQASQAGTAAVGSGYWAGVGGRIRWQTNGIRNGRRVIGTSFIVPLWADYAESDGTLKAAGMTILQNASNTLLTALTAATSPLCVYSRPSAPGAADGELHLVTSATVPDQVSWLTTRRS